MTRATNPVPASAYMLADHLDAALASGEDILVAGLKLGAHGDAGAREQPALRSAIELIRALELALITRVLKAREWSQRLLKDDARFKPQAQLFMAGSVALVDALAEFADATDADFDTGDGITAYFRSRGVIDAEAPALSDCSGVLVTEAFLVSRRIRLGELLDMIAAYLDALEAQFLLFADETTPAVPVPVSNGADAAASP